MVILTSRVCLFKICCQLQKWFAAIVSILANVFLASVIFSTGGILIKGTGDSGTKVFSKMTSLLLAAIAVMLIRKGFAQLDVFLPAN